MGRARSAQRKSMQTPHRRDRRWEHSNTGKGANHCAEVSSLMELLIKFVVMLFHITVVTWLTGKFSNGKKPATKLVSVFCGWVDVSKQTTAHLIGSPNTYQTLICFAIGLSCIWSYILSEGLKKNTVIFWSFTLPICHFSMVKMTKVITDITQS